MDKTRVGKTCCICFHTHTEHEVKGLHEYDTFGLQDDLIVLSVCGEHYLCIGCLYKVLTNYINHPINGNNSHFSCPYPFSDCVTQAGFKNVFDHHLLKPVFKSEGEFTTFLTHAEAFAFPGHHIIKCPLRVRSGAFEESICNSPILVSNETVENTPIGELVIQCDQNPRCLRKFCYMCKEILQYQQSICFDCKTNHECDNPNVYNYFFNKPGTVDCYDESAYLYLNREITVDIAVNQIIQMYNDPHTYIMCPVCKMGLYKTERCNTVTHHNIERCYACGRIGYKVKGLVDHWDTRGHAGCFRFDSDTFVHMRVPDYKCSDTLCHSHEKGDCNIQDHQKGIIDLQYTLKKAYVFSMLKSLLPNIRYQAYNRLYLQGLQNVLPYKQTLLMVSEFKKRVKDYTEEIVYEKLDCKSPSKFGFDKMYTIPPKEYISQYQLNHTDTDDTDTNSESETTPLLMDTFIAELRLGEQTIIYNFSNDPEGDDMDTL
ncbi:MAG: hypothetical protein EBU90_10815 [Proteobacteria bacterium]|nr:hypothetical protein [Pseudomonadota bacterium]NBP14651.1 hypothetical protein [bacterium]